MASLQLTVAYWKPRVDEYGVAGQKGEKLKKVVWLFIGSWLRWMQDEEIA
jgi:hypothetical protein